MEVYRILRPSEWDEFQAKGEYEGSVHDRRDGFIHLSDRGQVAETAQRVFASEPELVIAAVDPDAVAEWLRWDEAPRRGGSFPHLYAPLPLDAVVAVYRVAGAAEVDAALPQPQ